MWTTPFGDSLFNDHPFATFDAGAGVVHHINRVALTLCLRLPLYPKQRTSPDWPG
jgi:hypothetical protein